MMKTVIGIFQDRADIETAIDKFKSEGFKPKDFSIVMKDAREAEAMGDDTGANVAGAVSGGLPGAFMDVGLSRDEAEYYEDRVNKGAILLAVPTRENQRDLVMEIFDDSNASDIKTISREEPETRSRHQMSHEHPRQYAHVGTKGGKGKKTNRKRAQ